jgi:hypothetical protein
MLDPGAVGTVLIRREAERREAEAYQRGVPQPPPPRRRPGRLRHSLAAVLHRTADVIAPAPAVQP